jgi:hypothetical protein
MNKSGIDIQQFPTAARYSIMVGWLTWIFFFLFTFLKKEKKRKDTKNIN